MKCIYIENYLKISDQQKVKFLDFINKSKDLKVLNEKVIFSEESLILELFKDSDVDKTYTKIIDFCKEIKDIKVDLIKQTVDKSNNLILTFMNTNKQIRV
jgi:hypothetical protein